MYEGVDKVDTLEKDEVSSFSSCKKFTRGYATHKFFVSKAIGIVKLPVSHRQNRASSQNALLPSRKSLLAGGKATDCGIKMKELPPLHASLEGTAGFVYGLVFMFPMRKGVMLLHLTCRAYTVLCCAYTVTHNVQKN